MAFSHKLEHEDGTPADPPTFGRLRKYVALTFRMPTPETLADELTCGECGRVSRTDEPGWPGVPDDRRSRAG